MKSKAGLYQNYWTSVYGKFGLGDVASDHIAKCFRSVAAGVARNSGQEFQIYCTCRCPFAASMPRHHRRAELHWLTTHFKRTLDTFKVFGFVVGRRSILAWQIGLDLPGPFTNSSGWLKNNTNLRLSSLSFTFRTTVVCFAMPSHGLPHRGTRPFGLPLRRKTPDSALGCWSMT